MAAKLSAAARTNSAKSAPRARAICGVSTSSSSCASSLSLLKPQAAEITLQGVHSAADATNHFLVSGTRLEFEPRLVERLKEFAGALEEERRATRRRDPREDDSRIDLVALISGAVVFMNHAEFLAQAEQAFRMPDKEVSAGIQAMPKTFQSSAFCSASSK